MDNGFSKDMSGDKMNFMNWKAIDKDNVTIGNNFEGKIIAKGMVSLSYCKGKANIVLYVYGLKNNLLSVSHMCDQGYNVIFKAKSYQIKCIGVDEIVDEAVRTYNNVYVLKEKMEKCFLTNIDGSWLWHKILGHMNFDKIVELINKNVIKDLSRLSKLDNIICKSFQLGKKTRVKFKAKKTHHQSLCS